MHKNKQIQVPLLPSNPWDASRSCSIFLDPGAGFIWCSEEGYPVLRTIALPGGRTEVVIEYLGEHHPSLTGSEIVQEVTRRFYKYSAR